MMTEETPKTIGFTRTEKTRILIGGYTRKQLKRYFGLVYEVELQEQAKKYELTIKILKIIVGDLRCKLKEFGYEKKKWG